MHRSTVTQKGRNNRHDFLFYLFAKHTATHQPIARNWKTAKTITSPPFFHCKANNQTAHHMITKGGTSWFIDISAMKDFGRTKSACTTSPRCITPKIVDGAFFFFFRWVKQTASLCKQHQVWKISDDMYTHGPIVQNTPVLYTDQDTSLQLTACTCGKCQVQCTWGECPMCVWEA